MKISYVLSVLGFCLVYILIIGCKSTNKTSVFPSCVESKIEAIKKEPVRNPSAEVWQWEANGDTYYYFNSPCCDQYNFLYNDVCELICAPDGGFTGKGDQKCPEFDDTIKKELIWKDERK